MKQGFSILDADLHVIEPYDLYLTYMDPKWGDRIPRAEPRKLSVGELHDFKTADGSPARKPWREAPPKAVEVIRRFGADNFFFSTDYPHADCSFPHATEKFLALEGIEATSKRKILWDNPARMYNL